MCDYQIPLRKKSSHFILYFSRVTRHIEVGVHVMARSPHRYITPSPHQDKLVIYFLLASPISFLAFGTPAIKTLVRSNRAYTKTTKLTQTHSQKNVVIVCHVFILYAYCLRERKSTFKAKIHYSPFPQSSSGSGFIIFLRGWSSSEFQ